MSRRRRKKQRVRGKSNRWSNQKQVHRNAKERFSRFLFDKDREALMDLYNALNGTEYRA